MGFGVLAFLNANGWLEGPGKLSEGLSRGRHGCVTGISDKLIFLKENYVFVTVCHGFVTGSSRSGHGLAVLARTPEIPIVDNLSV